jgi:trimeric autotransporter adhesin
MTLTSVIGNQTSYAKKFVPTLGGSASGNGMYLPAADQVGISTGGQERVRIASSGNVGLGTQTPSQLLDVNGNIQANASLLLNNTGAVPNAMIVDYRSNNSQMGRIMVLTSDDQNSVMSFNTTNTGASNERMRINEFGNMGLGTTSPQRRLHVNGTVRLQGLPTHADNAAALAAGLAVDDVYKTATGEFRIVV